MKIECQRSSSQTTPYPKRWIKFEREKNDSKQNIIKRKKRTHACTRTRTHTQKNEIERRLITNHDKYLPNSRTEHYSFRTHRDRNQWMVFNTHAWTTTRYFQFSLRPSLSFRRFILAIKFIIRDPFVRAILLWQSGLLIFVPVSVSLVSVCELVMAISSNSNTVW